MNKTSYAYFQNKFMPLPDANVNIMNLTFMYGLGVFEGIRGYYNSAQNQVYLFRLREHIERLFDSARVMHLKPEQTIEEVCEIIVALVARNQPTGDIYIRPSYFAASNAISPCLAKTATDLCILTIPFGDYVDTQAGLKVAVSPWRRVEDNAIPARAKINGSYVNSALARTDAMLAGFDECILLSENGHVTEGSSMNLFAVRKGELVTTPGTENILEGITRSAIIQLAAREFGLKTNIRPVDRSELYTFDELFFCGTGAQVAPIAMIDGRQIGNGKFAISEMIRDRYIQICRGQVSGYDEWLTPVYMTAALPERKNSAAA